ncbi:MAG TPA: multiubiquitin domain-containing protein [Candidatus Saccharimonadales bacterium]|nr:multiubiquitin domain-containing protein [Candidatus Saccharimonadales bacterium]
MAPQPNTDTIKVNGRKHEWPNQKISFEEVVNLAFPNPPTGQDVKYEVTYRHGDHKKPQGTLEAGERVKVVDGMIFDVTPTDLS